MKILLFSKYLKKSYGPYINDIISILKSKEVNIFLSDSLEKEMGRNLNIQGIPTISHHEEIIDNKIDSVLSLGGDGTMLRAIALISESQIPLLGINLGRLGFLAGVDKDHIVYAINALINHNYKIEKRSLIELQSNLPVYENTPIALNDFTIHKRDTASMITIKVFINNERLHDYWADGIILSTPTGSTAYSLSCGGPIVFPSSQSFVLTPVAPHHLNVRPMVISDDSVISFEVDGRGRSFLCALDGRQKTITKNHKISIKKCGYVANLVQITGHTFINTLRKKMGWGVDVRIS